MEHLAAGLGSSLLPQPGLKPGWQCQAAVWAVCGAIYSQGLEWLGFLKVKAACKERQHVWGQQSSATACSYPQLVLHKEFSLAVLVTR